MEPGSRMYYMTNRVTETSLDQADPRHLETCSTAAIRKVAQGTCCCSNSLTLDACTWPKVKWLRSQVDRVVRDFPAEPAPGQSEEDFVDQLLEQLGELILHSEPFPADELPDPSFSDLSAECELASQRVFLPHDNGKAIPPMEGIGTRAQTVVVATATNVYYFYRDTDSYPDLPAWTRCVIPVPSDE